MSDNKKIHLVMTGGYFKAVYLTPDGLAAVDGTYYCLDNGVWIAWLSAYSNKERPHHLCHHVYYSSNLTALKRKLRRNITNMVYNKDSNLG